MRIREPLFEIKEEEDNRPDIYPNFDIDKPNKLVFQYHEPSKDLDPMHTPEKKIFKEHWKFYDVNLDAIRAEVADDLYFHPIHLSKEEFLSKQEFYAMLVEHIKRQEKRPAVGKYDPELPKTNIEIDFSKAQGRGLEVDFVIHYD